MNREFKEKIITTLTSQEFCVCYSVIFGVLVGVINGLFDNLHSIDLATHVCENQAYRARAATDVEKNGLGIEAGNIASSSVQNLSCLAVHLEKGRGGNTETQVKEFLGNSGLAINVLDWIVGLT